MSAPPVFFWISRWQKVHSCEIPWLDKPSGKLLTFTAGLPVRTAAAGDITVKRILLCLDGTWNAASKNRDEPKTNVYKLYQCAQHFSTPLQRAFYHEGVGTEFFEKVRGGIFGYGLFEQIKDAYLDIVNEYEPGTQIFVAGFSRGAFSARCLASFLAECGVLRNHRLDLMDVRDKRAVDTLWELYANRNLKSNSGKLLDFCSKYCHPTTDDLVGAVAVWDTVGSLGIPWEIFGDNAIAVQLQKRSDDREMTLLDDELSPKISKAYHAVALDEQRSPFRPTLWDGPRLNDGSILQVWFAGSHSNVGGGFDACGLSDITLDWMIRQLSNNHGLLLRSVTPIATGVWDPVGETSMDEKAQKVNSSTLTLLERRRVPDGALVHPTAERRIRGDASHTAIATRAILGRYTVAAN